MTRRRLLAAAAAVPALVAAETLRARLSSATAALRPSGNGTTADRCAACGAAGHSMLDPRCPAAPRVLG